MTPRYDMKGSALFSSGFRPFFLSATFFALLVMPVWLAVWRGELGLISHFGPVDWHVHEMLFGYGAAVVAGFLFTAVPNWTGRLPTRGWPLVVLFALWLAGRVAVAGWTGLGPVAVMLTDQVFLLAVAAMIAREIFAGKNWRNLKVLVPVSLLWQANILFHLEVIDQGTALQSRRFGIALLIFLIMLIGGRILPSFTRNWLVQRGVTRLPAAFGGFDRFSIFAGALALGMWVVAPLHPASALTAGFAAVMHVLRLWRWRGTRTWPSPLLLVLHVAYLMIPLGFLAVTLTALGFSGPAIAAHVFGIGAIGGMTMAVMARATLGHTGLALEAGPVMTTVFALVIGAMPARVAGPSLSLGPFDGIDVSALLWTAGFGLLALRLGPPLLRPRARRKTVSKTIQPAASVQSVTPSASAHVLDSDARG